LKWNEGKNPYKNQKTKAEFIWEDPAIELKSRKDGTKKVLGSKQL
jgi:hypothetical protein